MGTSKQFSGILVVLVTPLQADETLDEGALRSLLRRVLLARVHGVVVLGSAGEFAALTDDQKRAVIAVAAEEIDGRVPLIVGTGEPGTRRAVQMTRAAKSLGADAALVVPPYYYRPDTEAVLRYYRTVASEGGLPVLLYNIPFFTKVSLELDIVQTLAAEPGIVGIKDSSGNLRSFQELTSTVKSDGFSVVTGSDNTLFAQLVAGGDGCISPGANLVPDWFVELWEAMQHDRWAEAWELQLKIQALHRGIGFGTFPAGIKGALSLLGIGQNVMAAPNVPVTAKQMEAIESTLRELGLLE
jgi:4-hydroxy-tetrahydrodipicolinate synthase